MERLERDGAALLTLDSAPTRWVGFVKPAGLDRRRGVQAAPEGNGGRRVTPTAFSEGGWFGWRARDSGGQPEWPARRRFRILQLELRGHWMMGLRPKLRRRTPGGSDQRGWYVVPGDRRHWRRRAGWACAAMVIGGVLAADVTGQEPPGDEAGPGLTAASALDELRGRVPAGADDDRIIDAWISEELAALSAAADDPQAARDFRARFQSQITNAANTPEFTTRLVERTAEAFKGPLAACGDLSASAAWAMAWVLTDSDSVAALDGLSAGLGCSDRVDVRYVCAKGFARLRPKIGVDRVLTERTISELTKTGQAEANGVVAGAIYEALHYTDPDHRQQGLNAMLDVLEARLKKRRTPVPICDGGELKLLEFLRESPPTAQSVRERLVPQLAVMLRLDVERFAQDGVPEDEQVRLAESIDACEALLVSIVSPPAASEPSVREAMRKSGEEQKLEMKLALNEWIGTEQTPGILNATPWKVPVGAP
jgi:hypothetical protein